MLYQRIQFPVLKGETIFTFSKSNIEGSFIETPFFSALDHLAILTPIILSVQDRSSLPLADLTKVVYGIDGFLSRETGLIYQYLDNGLNLAIISVDSSQTKLSSEEEGFLSSLPRDRIGFNVDPHQLESFRSTYGYLAKHLIVRGITSENYTSAIASIRNILKLKDYNVEIYVTIEDDSIPTGERIALLGIDEHLHILEEPKLSEVDHQSTPYFSTVCGRLEAHDSSPDIITTFIQTIKTDRVDDLYTTVIVDENEKCLGLVYSNAQSIRQAFLEKKGIYWSRSRNQIWRKGDTSGMGQILLRMTLDCDRDALRMQVIQHGNPPSFCHQLTRTCWGNDHGITKMERVLKDRKMHAPEGSYTKRLFNDEDLLRKKLLEEVQELVEATEPGHVAAEAADVMYFLMTRCVAAGVSFHDVEKQLDLRSLKMTRRPGNAKDWRTANAENILKHGDDSSKL